MGVTLLDSVVGAGDDGGVVDGGVDGVVGGVDGEVGGVDGEVGGGNKGFSKSSAKVVRHLIPSRLPSAVRQSGTRVLGNMCYSLVTPKLFIDRKDRRK
jgi:hypothetical protein